jgi:hypothetical protein
MTDSSYRRHLARTGRRLGVAALAAVLVVSLPGRPAAAEPDPNPTGVLTPIGSVVNQRTITLTPTGTNHVYVVKFQYGDALPNGYREVFFTVSAGIKTGLNSGAIKDAFSFVAEEPLKPNEAVGASIIGNVNLSRYASVIGTLNINRLIEAANTGNATGVLVLSADIRAPGLVGAKLNFNAGFKDGRFVLQPPSASFSVDSPAFTAGAGIAGQAVGRAEVPDGVAQKLFVPIPGISSFGGIGSDKFKKLPGSPTTGADLIKSIKGGQSEDQANSYLFPETTSDQVSGYPVLGDSSTFLDDLQSPVYLLDSSVQFQEYRYENFVPLQIFDKGVNFRSIDFTGLTLDDDSGAPFFRADLTPAAPGEPGLGRAELLARSERFKQYFLEGMAMQQSDLHVSVEADTDAGGARQARVVLPDTLRTTSAARVMVDSDITMKRDYLADVTRGAEATVNDGVLGIWTEELAKSPNYGRLLVETKGLPGLRVSSRAVIVGGRVQVERGRAPDAGGEDTYRVVESPLDLQTFVDECQVNYGSTPESFRTELEAVRVTTCGRIAARMAERKPAFVTKLNTAAEYAELRLVYNALAHSLLYKVLAQDLPNSPYAAFANTGRLPADITPAGAFPESDYVARATATAGTERATAPCGSHGGQTYCVTGEATLEVFGGVDWDVLDGDEKDLDTTLSWFRAAVPTLGVANTEGVRSLNLGTALAGGLPEYVVHAQGDPRTSFSVTMHNLGTAAPAGRYLILQDVATNAEGEVLRDKTILQQVTTTRLGTDQWEKLDITCSACAEAIPGATKRWVQATVYLGTLTDAGTFTLEPEFNPLNTTGLVYQNDAAAAVAGPVTESARRAAGGSAPATADAGARVTTATGATAGKGKAIPPGSTLTISPARGESDETLKVRLR